MRLTDLFAGENKITDRGGARPATPKNAAISQQIRALTPGQTIQGEVISRNGGEVQVRMANDVVMNARLDQNMNLEIGKNMTFEVRNNGRTLTLSPLFANMATDANTLKALEMASLPLNETTVSMTRLLMEAGLPIDRNSLQQTFREINAYPQTDITNIIDLHKLGLPVTDENVAQIESYKNLNYQLVTGLNDVMEALPEVISRMVEGGNVEGAAVLFEELLALTGGEVALMEGTNAEAAEGELPQGGLLQGEAAAGENAEGVVTDSANAEEAAAGGINIETGEGEAASAQNTVPAQMTEKDAAAVKTALAESDLEIPEGKEQAPPERAAVGQLRESAEFQTLFEDLSRMSVKYTGQGLSGNLSASELLAFAGTLLQKGMAEHDTGLLREMLGNGRLRRALDAGMEKLLTLTPKEVGEAKQVEELYHRLDRQLKGISQALENAGQTSSRAYQATANLTQNVDFLHQINQMYAYVQLPLRLQQGNAHGDLYVYTNKRSLASADGKVSALLHLDMEYLGPVDVYVALQNEKVSTNFYVKDDSMLDFLSEHMDLLTSRLRQRGYDCKCNMQVRGAKESDEKKEETGGIRTLLAGAGHIKLAQYAFDVRA